MKTSIIFLFAALFLVFSVSPAHALRKVKGYTTKRGTYVAPHYQTSPDRSKFNNFSTKGNVNPFSGKKGTVDPFKSSRRR